MHISILIVNFMCMIYMYITNVIQNHNVHLFLEMKSLVFYLQGNFALPELYMSFLVQCMRLVSL